MSTATISRPGKTAPRLLEDLLNYDPRLEKQCGRNILTDPPPPYSGQTSSDVPGPDVTCQHDYRLKEEQSILPPRDVRADNDTTWKIAAFCVLCRHHVDLIIDFRDTTSFLEPCPSNESPLHHFVYDSRASDAKEIKDVSDITNLNSEFRFQCTVDQCRAVLLVRLRAPRLRNDQLRLLTDPALLEARKEKAFQADPARFVDHRTSKPVETLEWLHAYVGDALDVTRAACRQRIPVRNRLFMLSFGDDCNEILKELGFTYGAAKGESGDEFFWVLPTPTESESIFENGLRKHLEDTKHELLLLINKWPISERRRAKDKYEPVSALQEMHRLLGSLDYDHIITPLLSPDIPYDISHFCASLGALDDFSDVLLMFSYNMQALCDPANLPYYFECIQEIARYRKSEYLEERVMTLASEGHISRNDVNNAYRCFGVDPAHGPHLSDDHIVNLFQSRLPDVGSIQEGEMRQALRTLGQARQSGLIQSAASDSIETYAQALTWLGAQESMEDEYILPLLALKIEENPANKATGEKAVALIAEARNSQALRSWLLTGEMGPRKMEIGDAYNSLQIDDRTAILDTDTLDALFGARVIEAPGREEEFRQAVELIKAEMQNQQNGIDSMPTAPPEPQYPLNEWPVGLQNIGNTCYLNSLLQFFFTILPLRDLVLDISDHMAELTDEETEDKKVGGAIVRRYEIERAQAFALELRKIFSKMITSPTHEVIPEKDLARLTILKPSEDIEPTELTASPGEAGDDSSNLGTINGAPVYGPVFSPVQDRNDDDVLDNDRNEDNPDADAASDVTLLGDDVPEADREEFNNLGKSEQEDATIHDKPAITTSAPSPGDPMEISSSSQGREQNGMDQTITGMEWESPPERPPPMPPRPKTQIASKSLTFGEVENIAQQRDVTEVIGNVLYQLECAIDSDKMLQDGEQWDLIKDLFYGKYAWYIMDSKKDTEPKEEWFNTIIVNVASGPTDIYSALDDYFDPQDIQIENRNVQRYGVINHLPPILQINISRVMYDRGKGTFYKIEHHLQLENILYLDRYIDYKTNTDEILERRKVSWELKQRLRQLKTQKVHLSESMDELKKPTAMEAASDPVMSVQANPNDPIQDTEAEDNDSSLPVDKDAAAANPDDQHEKLANSSPNIADAIRTELRELDAETSDLEAQLSTLFSAYKRVPYRLQAVFIHRGTAAGGHYWVYICDFSSLSPDTSTISPYFTSANADNANNSGTWRCYNDSSVTPVADPERTIFSEDVVNNPGLRRATPNLLVYVRDDKKEQVVEAVHRCVAQEVLLEQQQRRQQLLQQQQEEQLQSQREQEQSRNSVPLPPRPTELYTDAQAAASDESNGDSTFTEAKPDDKWNYVWLDDTAGFGDDVPTTAISHNQSTAQEMDIGAGADSPVLGH